MFFEVHIKLLVKRLAVRGMGWCRTVEAENTKYLQALEHKIGKCPMRVPINPTLCSM